MDLKSFNVFLNWYNVLNNINCNLNDMKNQSAFLEAS